MFLLTTRSFYAIERLNLSKHVVEMNICFPISIFATLDWQLVASGLQLLALVAAVFSLLTLRKGQRYHALSDLHKELQSDALQESLRFIYSQHKQPQMLAEPETDKELRSIERVLNAYDLIALRAYQGVFNKKYVLASEWRILLLVWELTETFINKQRRLRGEKTDRETRRWWRRRRLHGRYKEWLEWLVDKAEDYRKKRHYLPPKAFHPAAILKPSAGSK